MDDTRHHVDGRRYVDPEVLVGEQRHVFDRAWLLVDSGTSLSPRGAELSVSWRDGERVRVTRQGAGVVASAPQGVRVAHWSGLLWVSTHPDPPSVSDYLGDLGSELGPYQVADFVPIHTRSIPLPCNWKAPLEISLECYHVDAVHGRTIGRLMNRGAQQCATFGDHQRMVAEVADYRWRRALDRLTTRGGPYREGQMSALYRYFLFPNTVINLLPSQMTVYTTWPRGADRCELRYQFYARAGAGPVEWARTRLTAGLSWAILQEDLSILRRFQAGVGGLAESASPLHTQEMTIGHFHRALSRWIDAGAVETERRVTGAG